MVDELEYRPEVNSFTVMSDRNSGMPNRVGRREPVRTCVGCRVRTGKAELVRIVIRSGEYRPDPFARMPGRGAYLHPDPKCLDRAARRSSLRRALRASDEVSADRLREQLLRTHIDSQGVVG